MSKGQMDELLPYDRENLERLLDAFSSTVSLEQIVSAYCQSGRNLNEAQKMLSSMQRRTPNCSASTSGEGVGVVLGNSSAGYQSDIPKVKASNVPKTKKHPTSVGTVSGVIGRDYGRQLPSTTGCWKRKPMVLNSADVTVSDEDQKDYNGAGESMRQEIEGFLFEMLGDGFSLDKSIIHDILGQCGYDVEQSMERLMNLSSPPTTENSVDLIKSHSNEELCGKSSSSSLPTTHRNSRRVQRSKKKSDLEQEILGALFAAPERTINEPVKILPVKVRPVVQRPLSESLIEYQSIISRKDAIEKDDDKNGYDYDLLRKAVAEYKATMKEYYTAAAVAFGKKEFEKAQKLREEGDFFMKKSKEADDKSAKKLVEKDDEEDMTFDFHEFEPETALRFLKVQMTNLAGISSFKYLKVIVGCGDGKSKHASRKRRILRLLEKEQIQWTEEGDGWTIVIQLSEVKPENLTFNRK